MSVRVKNDHTTTRAFGIEHPRDSAVPVPNAKARREATVKAPDDKNLEEGKFLLDKVWLDSA
jgi:hypothetical protein